MPEEIKEYDQENGDKESKAAETAELVSKLGKKIERAKKFYEENKENKHKMYLDYWLGNQGDAIVRLFGECDKVIANICMARVETLIPNIISRNIQVTVSGEEQATKRLNKLVHNELRNDRGYIEIYYATRDYAIFGECATKTSWVTKGDITSTEGSSLERDENQIKRIPLDRFFPDPDAENFNDVRYLVEKHCLDKDEFKDIYPDVNVDDISFGEEKEDTAKTIVWEIHCLEKNSWIRYEVDSTFKKLLNRTEEKKHPYDYAGNIKHPKKLLPQGEIGPIIPLQNELNKILTQMSFSRIAGGVKTLYNKGSITDSQKSKIINGLDMEYIEVEDLSKIQDRNMRFQSGPFLDSQDLILALVQLVTGASRMTLGGGAQNGVTARSDMLADARFEGRESQKREDIEDLVRGIVYKLIDNFQNYLDLGKKIELDGQVEEVTKEDLKFDYDPDVTVRINTVGKVVRQAERDALTGLFSTMIQSGAFQTEEIRGVLRRIVQTYDEFDGLDKMIEDLDIVSPEVPQSLEGMDQNQINQMQEASQIPGVLPNQLPMENTPLPQ